MVEKARNSYFLLQIRKSAEYFDKWLYRNDDNFYTDLYHVFADHYRMSNGLQNVTAHNCIGCNLAQGARHIDLFFRNNSKEVSESYFLSTYCLLFYVQAERIAEIYKELGYINGKGDFDWAQFPVLQKIKYWANLFKHPKSYMYLHHPIYWIEGDASIVPQRDMKIDNNFVAKYYSGPSNNSELKSLLANRKNAILFPNLLEFTKELCEEFEKIVTVISDNPEAIEKLSIYTIES